MKRANPFSNTTRPNKKPYQKLSSMTDEEMKNHPYTADELIILMNAGAAAAQTLRILTHHPHLINERDWKDRTVLMCALQRKSVELVRELLQKNANPNQKSTTKFNEYLTPIEFAKRMDREFFNLNSARLLKILNDFNDGTHNESVSSFKVNNLVDEEATRLIPIPLSPLTEQLNDQFSEVTEKHHVNAPFEPSPIMDSEFSNVNSARMLKILNDFNDRSHNESVSSFKVNNSVDEEATRLIPIPLSPLTEQLNDQFSEVTEKHHVNAPLEPSPAVAFLTGYEMQNRELDRSNMDDLFAVINNKPVVEQSVTDYLLYGLDELLANQSNLDYLMENFDDLWKLKP